jgi:hypothetical protein
MVCDYLRSLIENPLFPRLLLRNYYASWPSPEKPAVSTDEKKEYLNKEDKESYDQAHFSH